MLVGASTNKYLSTETAKQDLYKKASLTRYVDVAHTKKLSSTKALDLDGISIEKASFEYVRRGWHKKDLFC